MIAFEEHTYQTKIGEICWHYDACVVLDANSLVTKFIGQFRGDRMNVTKYQNDGSKVYRSESKA